MNFFERGADPLTEQRSEGLRSSAISIGLPSSVTRRDPMTLPLERIGRKGKPAALVVVVKAGPVDRETLAVQSCETFEDLLATAGGR